MDASRVADAIEELQNLNRTLATEPDGVSITRRIDAAVFSRKRSNYLCQRADAVSIVEQIMHDLTNGALRNLFAQDLSHAFLGLLNRCGQLSHPRRLRLTSPNE